jgi:hypothetical protein
MTEGGREEQRRLATIASSRIRAERKEVRLLLKEGRITLRFALMADSVQKLRVEQVVGWLPGVGPVTLPKLLRDLRVSGTRVVGQLTPREREALTSAGW